jgi:hypothetical protein
MWGAAVIAFLLALGALLRFGDLRRISVPEQQQSVSAADAEVRLD